MSCVLHDWLINRLNDPVPSRAAPVAVTLDHSAPCGHDKKGWRENSFRKKIINYGFIVKQRYCVPSPRKLSFNVS